MLIVVSPNLGIFPNFMAIFWDLERGICHGRISFEEVGGDDVAGKSGDPSRFGSKGAIDLVQNHQLRHNPQNQGENLGSGHTTLCRG